MDAYLAEKVAAGRHRPKTTYDARRRLNAFADWCGNRDVAGLTRADLVRWFAQLDSGRRSAATRHQCMRYVRAFFAWLVELRVLRENPASRMSIPAPSQSRRDIFCTVAQRDILLDACRRDDLRLVLLLGFFMGMRINEIVNCRWDWFSGDLTVCTVRNTAGFRSKSGKERQIPVHSRVRAFLETMPRGDGWILHPGKMPGRNWRRWDPQSPWRRLVAECSLKWVGFHTMRHTFGSLHAIAGTPKGDNHQDGQEPTERAHQRISEAKSVDNLPAVASASRNRCSIQFERLRPSADASDWACFNKSSEILIDVAVFPGRRFP